MHFHYPEKERKIIFSGSVHITPEEFENVALFVQLDLPSTQIRHENEAFRKHSSNRRKLETLPILDEQNAGRRTFHGAF